MKAGLVVANGLRRGASDQDRHAQGQDKVTRRALLRRSVMSNLGKVLASSSNSCGPMGSTFPSVRDALAHFLVAERRRARTMPRTDRTNRSKKASELTVHVRY